jgi:putative ABC transport system permease protein
LIVPVRHGDYLVKNSEIVKSEFLQIPYIIQASVSSSLPGQEMSQYLSNILGQDDEKSQSMHLFNVDHDFMKQFQIQLAAGRYFDKNISSDKTDAFILNESAVKAFGWNSPEEALDHQIYSAGHNGAIIGVMKDFHYQGLQRSVGPLILDMNPRRFRLINLTVGTESLKDTLTQIEGKWGEFFPNIPFEYFFLDERFDQQYQKEEQVGKIGSIFTFFGLVIACLGLFGLASFIAEQRTKEIGIRKVLGASIPNIMGLLSGEFSKWVLAANIFAWPAAYFVMNKWLQNFAYRANIGIGIFLLSALAAFAVAILTVSYQSLEAARANPVDSLHYE